MTERERQPDSSVEPGAGSESPARRGQPGVLLRRGIATWQSLPTMSKRLAAGGAAAIALLIAALLWRALRSPGAPPRAQMERALELLDRRGNLTARRRALEIARRLDNQDYRAPDFAGAAEFIQGIVAFRDAEEARGLERRRQYARAISSLRAAEEQALDASRRAEWSYALGASLFALGRPAEARPLLEEAVKTFAPAKSRARQRLAEVYLDLKTPETRKKALALNTVLLESNEVQGARRDRVSMQRARILLALERPDEAEQALSLVSEDALSDRRVALLRARILMARDRYEAAANLLESLAGDVGLDQTVPREASYLLGVCAERLGEVERAIESYERTAERFPQSQEGIAANIRGGALLRRQGRHEEAYAAYRRALQSVNAPDRFQNQWLSLEEFRRAILDAWNAWIAQETFQQAINLADHMTPVFPATQAADLGARANQLWAEWWAKKLRSAPYSERIRHQDKLRKRWRESGRAYARLAEALRTDEEPTRYSEVLWTSAEHFRKGRDFRSALEQLTRFINAQPEKRLALALVRRAELLMNLDRLDEALEHLQHVVDNYSTDAAAFEARYLLGRCHLERGEPGQAEQVWRNILDSRSLEPAAREWRLALFSLGKLLYRTAEMSSEGPADSTNRQGGASAGGPSNRGGTAWDEAVRRLDEYVKRYPETPEAIEARYLLAKSLQRQGVALRRKLQQAETETNRNELRLAAQNSLGRALDEFLRLRNQLGRRDASNQLDRFGRDVLQSCIFEIAHTRYASGDYEQALASYREAVNRYPDDPQILVAYLQMANCHDRLQRPVEARSMLEQAKIVKQQLPEEAFSSRTTSLTGQEWETWLDRAARLHVAPSSPPPDRAPNTENER